MNMPVCHSVYILIVLSAESYLLVYLVMGHSMVIEVAGSGEAFPADAALVGLLTTVNSPENLKYM